MNQRAHTVLDSPIGPITAVAENGAIVGLYMEAQRHLPDSTAFGAESLGGEDENTAVLGEARTQLEEYFAGKRTVFDLPLAFNGTPFQRRVWQALLDIPYGERSTYGEIAELIGSPTAYRAVGAANGRNPISIVVPCHRLVSSTGKLISYGGGLQRKRHLLDMEERISRH